MKTAVATMVALTFSASLALAQTSGGNAGSGGSPGGASSTTGTTTKDQDTPPLKGANSFTEGEAKSRAEARGFSDIKELKKDNDGIWRGQATQAGKQVQIAIDYKGNVVPTSH
jgi:putative membrane protein